jgi:hypothetical protein
MDNKRIRSLRFATSYFEPKGFAELEAMRDEYRDEYAKLIREKEILTSQIMFYASQIERMYQERDDANQATLAALEAKSER